MGEIIKKFAGLINVKTIVTIMVASVFVRLAERGTIAPGEAMSVIVMVIGFYFGTQHEKGGK